MISLFPDKRKSIAGTFFISDSKIKNRSKKAFKKIQAWKMINQEAVADVQLQLQLSNLVKNSFFASVSNNFILEQENYFEQPLEN